jgi:predicted PurR-regulated permease PerM
MAAAPTPGIPEAPAQSPSPVPTPVVRATNWPQTIIAGGVILFFCSQAEIVLVVLLLSLLIAFILAPIVDLLERAKLPRSVASAIAVLLLLSAGVGITYVSYNEGTAFIRDLPKYSSKIREQIARWQVSAEQFDGNNPEASASANRSVLGVNAPSWVELATRGFGSAYQGLIAASFIPFIVYFMLSWHRHARSATVMLFRMEHRHAAYVTLGLIGKMMRTFMIGNLLVGLFLSIASTVAFAILHLPFFYFVGPLSGFLSLVPYLGMVLALLPPMMVGMGQMDSGGILFLLAVVFALHVLALNVLYPKFLGNRLQLNPLTVSISLLFWGWLWGAMGLVVAIPLTAAMKIVFDHIDMLRPYGAWLGE